VCPIAHVSVGDIARLKRLTVDVHLDRDYTEIGIRSFGKGIFHKAPLSGAALGAKRVFWIEPGDLVLNNVFAWEGSIAVADGEQKGLIGSHRFMTYSVDRNQVDQYYLLYYLLSDPGLELIRRASPGSAGRNRTLGIEAFESLEIPLPPIDVQRDTARRLDATIRGAREGTERVAHASRQGASLIEAIIQQRFDWGIERGWPLCPLGDVAHINPPPARLEASTPVGFVPMRAVDASRGRIVHPEIRAMADLKTGYKQFYKGDVIFARITPCMQNGKTAVVDGLPTDYGYGSTEFHVVRPGDSVTASWLHHIFRTASFKANAARHFTGTAGQQRVPASFLEKTLIPVPPVAEQRSAIVQLESILRAGRDLAERYSLQRARFTALQASVLNETFGSLT
jgi:type I restriction enzyme S subunit